VARRREVLRWGLAGALGGAAPAATALLASRRAGSGPRPGGAGPAGTPLPAGPPAGAFTEPLPIPEVLAPVSTAGGVDRYEIRQLEGRQRIRPDVDSVVWGYQGRFPGPTIETRRGRRVEVTHHNELPVPTVVHLHGAVVTAEHDGYPADFVLPAGGDWATDAGLAAHAAHAVAGVTTGSRTYVYPNDQPATALWYHDHRMSFSGPQQYRGLAAFYLIRDDVEDALPLPRGARELPLMLADRAFDEDGALFYPSLDPDLREPGVAMEFHWSGMLGETIVVNGVAWPYCEVDAALYRLRLVNASNARRYQLELDPPPPGGSGFIQIGSDLGLLPQPVRYDTFLLSPGERYDLLVDFAAYAPGTSVLLRNTSEDGPAGYVMRFDVARRVTDDARVPDVLVPDLGPAAPPPGRPADRSFSFFSGPDGTGLPGTINTNQFAGDRIDAQPALGSTEIWNLTADPDHPVHLHLAHFRVLSRDGGPPEPQDAGLKDTVFVPEGGVQIAVTFTGYRGKYVFHCHNLEHADAGMMANLEVV
jgi:spore coat protein A